MVAGRDTSPAAVAAEKLVSKAQRVGEMYDEEPVEVLAVHDGSIPALQEWAEAASLPAVAQRAGELAAESLSAEPA